MAQDDPQVDGEREEVEWLKEQFDPSQHVPKGTAIKIQVSRHAAEVDGIRTGWVAQCALPSRLS